LECKEYPITASAALKANESINQCLNDNAMNDACCDCGLWCGVVSTRNKYRVVAAARFFNPALFHGAVTVWPPAAWKNSITSSRESRVRLGSIFRIIDMAHDNDSIFCRLFLITHNKHSVAANQSFGVFAHIPFGRFY
jgi:hypothetical protein